MQHKRSVLQSGMLKLGIGMTILAIVAALMTAHVPAPQHAIVKELDAKAFLEPKQ